jgi:hypothetical protein
VRVVEGLVEVGGGGQLGRRRRGRAHCGQAAAKLGSDAGLDGLIADLPVEGLDR